MELNNATNGSYCPGVSWYGFWFWVDGIATTVVCFAAIVGNIICIIVLSQPSMRSSVNSILLALSGSGLIHVVACLVNSGPKSILQEFCLWPVYTHWIQPTILPYVFPIGTIAQVSAVYFTVLVSLERYIAVCWPLRARIWCTCRRSNICCAGILLCSVLYNLPVWWELGTKPMETRLPYGNPDFVPLVETVTPFYKNPAYLLYYINLGSLVVIRLIPFTALVVLNYLIYRQVRRMNRNRKELTNAQAQEIKVSRVIRCIVPVFLLGNIVTIISHMMGAFMVRRPVELRSASNFLVLLNSASYFVTYCFTCMKFQAVLCKLLSQERWNPTDVYSASQVGMTPRHVTSQDSIRA